MRRLIFLLLLGPLLIGCSAVFHPPSQAQIDAALQDARQLLDDPNAVQLGWYRDRLEPAYSVSYPEQRSHRSGLTTYFSPVLKPRVAAPPMLLMMAVTSFIALVALAVIVAMADQSRWMVFFGGLIAGMGGLHTGALVIAGAAMVFVEFAFPPERYMPFHFALFLGHASALTAFVGFVLLAFGKDAVLSASGRLRDAVVARRTQARIEKERKLAVASAQGEFLNVRTRELLKSMAVFADTLGRDLEEDRRALVRLNEGSLELAFGDVPPSFRDQARREAGRIVQRLKAAGHGDTPACERLEEFCERMQRERA